ncbi:alpha/beta hydrolase [Labrys okinawensis]|uniref:Alpha/beta hydrolase n=2 Tax=Labrys okinawensis TaxID=346911 RepID=A0A2S9Q987_9HYPH|nr:alpha/beta hydrolase [Labrys okinawensis]
MQRTGSCRITGKCVDMKAAKLQTEAFGAPSDPPIVLIMGMMASMLWWPERFCRELADREHYVIRYDQRDTGLSTHYPQGAPGYSSSDLADDVMAVLDAYGLEAAHLVGMSMGGFVAQEVALRHQRRVLTLTLISTSPLAVEGLPPSTKAYREHSATAEGIDWSDLGAIADFLRRDAAMLAGTRHPHDAEAVSALIAQDMARAPSFASATNHFALVSGEGQARLRACDLTMPVLAIHGTADPLFPIAHGEAFATVVSKARLHRIEGGGHEIHDSDIDEMVLAIAHHAA